MLITSFALLLSSVGSVSFAIYAVMLKPIVHDLRGSRTQVANMGPQREHVVTLFGHTFYAGRLSSSADAAQAAPVAELGLRPYGLAFASMVAALAITDAVTLTYLGQNNGTSVFLDVRTAPPAVYRLPTSALAIDSAARSISG